MSEKQIVIYKRNLCNSHPKHLKFTKYQESLIGLIANHQVVNTYTEQETSQRTAKRSELLSALQFIQDKASGTKLIITSLLYFHKPEVFIKMIIDQQIDFQILDAGNRSFTVDNFLESIVDLKKYYKALVGKMKLTEKIATGSYKRSKRKKPSSLQAAQLKRIKNADNYALKTIQAIPSDTLLNRSYAEIATFLRESDFPTPSKKRNKNGDFPWTKHTVMRLLKRLHADLASKL